MKKNIRLITTGIVILGIGAFSGYSLFASDRETPKEAAPKAQSIEEIQANQGKPVKVASVSQQNIEITQTFYGTVAPFAEANVQGKHGGKIIALKGEEGEYVKAGSLIVQFDASDYQFQKQQAVASKNAAKAGVNQAQSNYQTADTTLKRYEGLYKKGFISRQALDEMKNASQVAQAGLGSAEEQVNTAAAQINLLENTMHDMKIAAPISGIIDAKNFNLNEVAGAGSVIYHIVDIDRVYIEVEIPETHIAKIREKMAVTVAVDSLNGQEFSGVVERIIPTGNRDNRNFTAKVLVQNPDRLIKPGMFSRVNVTLETIPNALSFDKKALLKEGDEYYVFKVRDGQVEKVRVDVKHRNTQTVAVSSDELSPQDQIVIEGVKMLSPNDRVKVL